MSELEKYAAKTMDNELLGKIKIVRTYNTAIPSHVNKIQRKTVHDNDVAGTIQIIVQLLIKYIIRGV